MNLSHKRNAITRFFGNYKDSYVELGRHLLRHKSRAVGRGVGMAWMMFSHIAFIAGFIGSAFPPAECDAGCELTASLFAIGGLAAVVIPHVKCWGGRCSEDDSGPV